MKKIIFLFMIILSLSQISALIDPKIYYNIDLKYSHGNLSINSIDIYFSDTEIKNNPGLYSANIRDPNGNTIKTINFSVPNKILYDNIDEDGNITSGGEEELNETDFELYVPYNKNAKEIIIFYKNNELTTLDVSMYSKDNAFNSYKNNKINNLINEPKKENLSNDNFQNTNLLNRYWWIVIILVILIILVIYITKKRKRVIK